MPCEIPKVAETVELRVYNEWRKQYRNIRLMPNDDEVYKVNGEVKFVYVEPRYNRPFLNPCDRQWQGSWYRESVMREFINSYGLGKIII